MSATRPEVIEGVAHVLGQGSLGKATGLKRGFFRTRSAPPVSRAKRPSISVNDEMAPAITATAPVGTGHDGGAPSVILEQFSSIDSTDTGTLIGADTLSTCGTKDGGAVNAMQAISLAGSSTNPSADGTKHVGSRLGPSGPSLEAILLDRKRRLAVQAAGGGNNPAVPAHGMVGSSSSPVLSKDFALSSAPASPSPASPSSDPASRSSSVRGTSGGGKGTKFKSSPLGGGERTGVVVAEKVGAAYPVSAPLSLSHEIDEKATENN